MFWDAVTFSMIDEVLDQKDVTLKEVLDKEDVLQECKASNKKLIQYLIKPEIMEQLIDFVITEPLGDIDDKNRFKYSNIACELLTSNMFFIHNVLFTNESLLNRLYSFIQTDKKLNPLLASFFSKIMCLLLTTDMAKMFEFLTSKDDFIQCLIKHLNISAIMDFTLKLITSTHSDDKINNFFSKWFHEQKLIGKLISLFKKEVSEEVQVNSAQLLCDIIRSIREYQTVFQESAESSPLLEEIESTSTVSELLTIVFENRSENSLVNVISILQYLLEYKRYRAFIQPKHSAAKNNNENKSNWLEPLCLFKPLICNDKQCVTSNYASSLDIERLTKSIEQVHAAIILKLEDFHSVLLNPPLKPPIQTTFGTISKPLGVTRLEIVHLIRALLASNNSKVNKKIEELKILPDLIDLFFNYPHNNFLHTQVENSIKYILDNNEFYDSAIDLLKVNHFPKDEESVNSLINQLFTECKIIERILKAWNEYYSETECPNPKPGYMGHIIKIANHIVKSKHLAIVKQNLEKLPSETLQDWNNLVEVRLAAINKRIQLPLFNENITAWSNSNASSSTEGNALQQTFIDYQMQQMTRNLCIKIEISDGYFTGYDELSWSKVDQVSNTNSDQFNSNDTQSKKSCLYEGFEECSTDNQQLIGCQDAEKSESSFKPFLDKLIQMMIASTPIQLKTLLDTFDSSDQENRAVSNNDPWSNAGTCSPAAVALSNNESESWANFSNLSNDFNSSPIPPNACVTDSSAIQPSNLVVSKSELIEILESVYLGVLKDPANDLEISSLLDEILLDCKKFDENNKNKISSELDSNVTSCPE